MRRKAATDPDWMKLALWVAKPHEWREDREDVRQEALLGAWRSVQKTRGLGLCSANQAAVKGARWAVAEYLRRAPGGSRCLQIDCLSLDQLMAGEDRAWEPAARDELPALLARLDLWDRAALALTGEEFDVLRRLYVRQQECQEIGREIGRSEHWVWNRASTARRKLKEALADEAAGGSS